MLTARRIYAKSFSTRFTAVVLLVVALSTALCALDRQPNADYRARRVALANKAKGMVILFAPMESRGRAGLFGFRQEDNFYYLTGITEPDAALLIASPSEDGRRPYQEMLFLPAHNKVGEHWTGIKMSADTPDVKQTTGFDKVAMLDTLRDTVADMLTQSRMRVYTDVPSASDEEPSPSWEPMQWLNRANAFPGGSFADVKPMIEDLRQKKDAGEIALVQKAIDASVAAHLAAMKSMKPGLKEFQIAALMQYEFQNRGCERPAYAPIVGSGFNSTVLHYSENTKTIDPGDLVVMDVAGEYSMYASDITRTVPASGKFTARQREIYDIVLGAQRAAQAAFVAGKSTLTGNGPNSLVKVAQDYINTHGKDLKGEPLGKYFIHGLGHPVGLEVHDVGINAVLDKGSVFTIEPGIYIPEEKLGVRIEDTFYVDEQGKLINMSGKLPHTADEVEAAMKK